RSRASVATLSHWTLVEEIWLRYHFVIFNPFWWCRRRLRALAAPSRALPLHDAESEVDDRLLRSPAFDRLDDHHGSVPAHFVTIGANAAQRGDGGFHEFKIVEAEQRDFFRNRDVSTRAFEQRAQSEVVVDAEHRIDIRRLGKQVGE